MEQKRQLQKSHEGMRLNFEKKEKCFLEKLIRSSKAIALTCLSLRMHKEQEKIVPQLVSILPLAKQKEAKIR